MIISFWSGSVIGWMFSGSPYEKLIDLKQLTHFIAIICIGLLFVNFIKKSLIFICCTFPISISLFSPSKNDHLITLALVLYKLYYSYIKNVY